MKKKPKKSREVTHEFRSFDSGKNNVVFMPQVIDDIFCLLVIETKIPFPTAREAMEPKVFASPGTVLEFPNGEGLIEFAQSVAELVEMFDGASNAKTGNKVSSKSRRSLSEKATEHHGDDHSAGGDSGDTGQATLRERKLRSPRIKGPRGHTH